MLTVAQCVDIIFDNDNMKWGRHIGGKFLHNIESEMFIEFLRQEYWSGLPFPSPVGHILSELSTMTHSSWVALHGMAYSFTELDKAVVHVIRLVSFLWLWFSVCLPSYGKDKRIKYRTEIDEFPRLIYAQYATGDQWRNNFRKNEEMVTKKNNTPLWMSLMLEVKSDAVKSNIA